MLQVRTLLVKLGVAVLLLRCYAGAELCIDEGASCVQEELTNCTRRAVCKIGTEINIGEDESGCKQCQKPCSEKIYIQYSSLKDKTPATGWYTYIENNYFKRVLTDISFFLRKKDGNWILTESKFDPFVQREITHRIELSYKNDTRTRMSLDNFGIDEDERKLLNIFIAPKEISPREGTPYEEKLVIFCPGKCLCKNFRVTAPFSGYCFTGVYERIDENNETEQPKQETSMENLPIRNRNKTSYPKQSRTKRYAGFAGFKPSSHQSDSPNSINNNNPLIESANPNKDSATNYEQNIEQLLDSIKSMSNANANTDSDTNDERNNDQLPVSEKSITNTNPNKDSPNQNWRQESYKLTSESYDDQPFEFTFDEEYHVWFVGRGDMMAAVIPEASPCPEMIQKQPWFAVNEEFKLKLGMTGLGDVIIKCTQRD